MLQPMQCVGSCAELESQSGAVVIGRRVIDHFVRPGLRFDVVDSGAADAPAVVLLHGFPQQPSSFGAVASRLNAEGLRTLTQASVATPLLLGRLGGGTIGRR